MMGQPPLVLALILPDNGATAFGARIDIT
ncbi:MAG: hypothetical protein ACJA1M_000237 [Alphaproteobacteria bacterium]